jgi:ATP-binding cassette, subfamily B, bacterial
MQQRMSEFRETLQNTREVLSIAWEANPRLVVLVLAVQAAGGIFPAAVAWTTKQIIDLLVAVVTKTASDSVMPFLPWVGLLVAMTLLDRARQEAGWRLQEELSRQLTYQTQTRLIQELARFDGVRWFESPSFHDTLEMAQRGLYSGPSMMVSTLSTVTLCTITLVSYTGMILLLSPLLALVLLAVTLPQLWLRTRVGVRRFMMYRESSTRQRQMNYLFWLLTATHFVTEVRLFNLKNYFLGRYQTLVKEVQAEERQQAWHEARGGVIMAAISSVTSGAALLVVVFQALAGKITPGVLTLYLGAITSVQGSLFQLVDVVGRLHEQSLYYGNFRKLRALPNDIPAPENPVPVPILQHSVELKNVVFRYDAGQSPVLNDVSLTIPAGKTVALVGLNGAGKTTLVKLLMRLYDPEGGQVLWDNIDLRDVDVKELREHTGTIFQDFVHYDLTARENIGLGSVAHIEDIERIQQVAKDSRIDDFIQTLPQKYETVLSKWLAEEGQGTDLSGGQWQRIALARMYMRDADFLILDEPTAALDAEAEYEIYSHFARLLKDRTALLISHRFSTVRMADLIAVLEAGKITEYGTHQELLAAGKTYARLYTMQADQYK